MDCNGSLVLNTDRAPVKVAGYRMEGVWLRLPTRTFISQAQASFFDTKTRNLA